MRPTCPHTITALILKVIQKKQKAHRQEEHQQKAKSSLHNLVGMWLRNPLELLIRSVVGAGGGGGCWCWPGVDIQGLNIHQTASMNLTRL